jgi:MFS family permease
LFFINFTKKFNPFLVAIIPMAREFNWNLRLQGYILSSFPIGYLTSQLFAHIFVRRFGTKTVLALAVFTWSLVTFATPFLAPLPFLLICSRIALGFGEGLGKRKNSIEFN